MSLLRALLFVAVLAASVFAQASNDNPNGKTLYVSDPHCNSYQCRVNWRQGQDVFVNWINAPRGKLDIQLAPESDQSLPTYTLASNIGAVHGKATCNNAGTGKRCGRWDGKVPADVRPGEYSIVVKSLSSNAVGYTDVIRVRVAKKDQRRRLPEQLDDDVEA
ncbi:hypothetical protein FA09DRAFT_338984 [Tilletiopsis washingtonensis]|uniref:Uncharacterized protein n=1 Tax=Tilletiopsis washingtonensis TaxID=58919 RepID=A0A316Z8U2_9BASI|nr:hypothetical protein FA09DRAFT_338984 [Tilletiopsis washingtonensis]PWN98019.1 hypothetical protein FA09DRAFT_338984 [Tilletiopsis washingtonensis]